MTRTYLKAGEQPRTVSVKFFFKALNCRKVSLIASALIATLSSFLHVATASSVSSDWTVSISTSHMDKVLNYPDSNLQPLIKASITFEQGLPEYGDEEKALEKAGYITEEDVANTLYENIYYAQSQAIGLHRYKELGIRPGTPGNIKIKVSDGPFRVEEANAAANATARIFLDAAVKKSALKSIVVPRDDFDLFIIGLQRYGFRPVRIQPSGFVSASVLFSVQSEPAGRSQLLGYGAQR